MAVTNNYITRTKAPDTYNASSLSSQAINNQAKLRNPIIREKSESVYFAQQITPQNTNVLRSPANNSNILICDQSVQQSPALNFSSFDQKYMKSPSIHPSKEGSIYRSPMVNFQDSKIIYSPASKLIDRSVAGGVDFNSSGKKHQNNEHKVITNYQSLPNKENDNKLAISMTSPEQNKNFQYMSVATDYNFPSNDNKRANSLASPNYDYMSPQHLISNNYNDKVKSPHKFSNAIMLTEESIGNTLKKSSVSSNQPNEGYVMNPQPYEKVIVRNSDPHSNYRNSRLDTQNSIDANLKTDQDSLKTPSKTGTVSRNSLTRNSLNMNQVKYINNLRQDTQQSTLTEYITNITQKSPTSHMDPFRADAYKIQTLKTEPSGSPMKDSLNLQISVSRNSCIKDTNEHKYECTFGNLQNISGKKTEENSVDPRTSIQRQQNLNTTSNSSLNNSITRPPYIKSCTDGQLENLKDTPNDFKSAKFNSNADLENDCEKIFENSLGRIKKVLKDIRKDKSDEINED